MITRPTNLQLADWADQVSLDLDRYGAIPKIVDDDWQNWGAQLVNNLALGHNIPNPYQFESWTDWAERLCGVLA